PVACRSRTVPVGMVVAVCTQGATGCTGAGSHVCPPSRDRFTFCVTRKVYGGVTTVITSSAATIVWPEPLISGDASPGIDSGLHVTPASVERIGGRVSTISVAPEQNTLR